MSPIETLTLTGVSKTQHKFEVYPIGTNFSPVGAVYAITRRAVNLNQVSNHTPIYIGETGDLSTRFGSHHKQECFDQNNANCVSVHRDDNEGSRLAKEYDILNNYNWPCND